MRVLIWAVLIAALGVALALVGRQADGTVLLLVPPLRIELSFFLFVCLLGALVLTSFALAWLAQRALDFPRQVARYRRRREEVGAQRALREAVKALFEGRFARAERAARTAQLAPDVAGVAALVGARAAHKMRQADRRDEWLHLLDGDRELAMAQLVSSAEMWTESREPERALEAIDRLQASGARHLYAARIALDANARAQRWDEVVKGARVLDKRNALHPVAVARYKMLAYRALLAQRQHDPAALESAWSRIPASDRRRADLALEGARLLGAAGRSRSAAAALEAALNEHWDERLLDAYAQTKADGLRERIERAEGWLRSHPRDAVLLRCVGRLCLHASLWGKARSYLEESLRLEGHPVTLLSLALLAEAVGNDAEAAQRYRAAALRYAGLDDAAQGDFGTSRGQPAPQDAALASQSDDGRPASPDGIRREPPEAPDDD